MTGNVSTSRNVYKNVYKKNREQQRRTEGRNVHEKGLASMLRRDTEELQFFILEEESNKKA